MSIRIRRAALTLTACTLALAGCQTHRARVARESTETRDQAMLGQIATLAGEWEMFDEDGSAQPGSVFAVTSAGSAVREIMFPGHEHEMTNLYHMDGPNLVITHYCASGNQPRMVAKDVRHTDEGAVYEFEFDSVSNLREEHNHFMGQMTLTLLTNGTIREDWRSYDSEHKLSEPTVFTLRRKRAS